MKMSLCCVTIGIGGKWESVFTTCEKREPDRGPVFSVQCVQRKRYSEPAPAPQASLKVASENFN